TVNGILAPPCYSECGIAHNWVCGSNGNSYQNPCQLIAYACEHPNENITIKNYARCENINGECTNEPFQIKGSNETFVIFLDEKRNWRNAEKKCEAEFMRTAHPSNEVAIKLRKHLLESCG
ncbi:unnamed protein product, partial [Meganyctiphanes norvegica]